MHSEDFQLRLQMQRQMATQGAREARPSKKIVPESPMEFRSALARFYLAVDAEGMDARRKLNELAQWFGGSAGEIVAAYVPQQDAETAYPTCLSRLEQLYGGNADSIVPLTKQLAQGKAIGENDLECHLFFFAKLLSAETVAIQQGQRDQLDKRDVVAEIAENRVKHLCKKMMEEDVRRQEMCYGGGIDFEVLKRLVNSHILLLQTKKTLLPSSNIKLSSIAANQQQQQQPRQHQQNNGTNINAATVPSYSEALRDSPKQMQSTDRCNICSQYHRTEVCAQLVNLAVDDRVKRLKDLKLCFNCFSKEHLKPQCDNIPSCATCSRKHHTLLHGRTMMPPAVKVNSSSFHPVGYHHAGMFQNNQPITTVGYNSNNSNYQVQQQQLQLLQPQQLAPQGRIHATESATSAHNDVADLVLSPPAAPAAGGEAQLIQ